MLARNEEGHSDKITLAGFYLVFDRLIEATEGRPLKLCFIKCCPCSSVNGIMHCPVGLSSRRQAG